MQLIHLSGIVACADGTEGTNASQFYITTGQELDSLDGKHTIFGEVSEGLEVLQQIDEAFVDDAGRPLQNIRWVSYSAADAAASDADAAASDTDKLFCDIVRFLYRVWANSRLTASSHNILCKQAAELRQ